MNTRAISIRILTLTLVLAKILVQCSDMQSFVLTRILIKRGYYDRFKIVSNSSECKESSYLDCKLKNGRRTSTMTRCECSCDKKSTTFGFYDGNWTCLNNTKLRRQSGCRTLFEGENPTDSPLKVLTNRNYHILFNSASCSMDYTKSRHLDCDGSWQGLVSVTGGSKPFFLLQMPEVLPGQAAKRFFMKVSRVSILSGRIVSLHFDCKNPAFSSCLLFKMAGNLRCPFSPGPVVLPTTHSTKVSTLRTKIAQKNTYTTEAISSSIMISIVTTSTEGTTKKFPAVAVGVGTALGSVILIGVTAAMVMAMHKRLRKAMPRSPSQDELSAPHNYEACGPLPERRPGDGLVYDYAVVPRQNAWARHRNPNDGYEIPQDNTRENQITPNEAYEIPQDNNSANHIDTNDGYEIPQDVNKGAAHREPNQHYEILGAKSSNHSEPNSCYEKPQVSYVDMSGKISGKNDYMALDGVQQTTDNKLYDSDEYVSIY